MNVEKQIILDKIDLLISKRKTELLNKLPSIHNIDDGFIVRFFTEWDNCEEDGNIKFKKIVNKDNPDESVVFFFLPKNSRFELNERFHIGELTCLSGKLEIFFNGKKNYINNYSKIVLNSNQLTGIALENTYIVTTSNRCDWSETTKKYIEEHQL